MQNTMKIAISIPKEDYYKIERIRKKLGFARSVFIDKAVKFWIEHQERQQLIKRYKEGYKNNPEDVREIEAMEGLYADAFKEEGLK